MTWGGSLNSEGTDYLRLLRDMDKVIEILEGLKTKLGEEEKENIDRTIEIIVDHVNNVSKG